MGLNQTGQSVSVTTDDNLAVLVAPKSAVAGAKPTLTELKSDAFVDITYDLTAGSGWAETTSQETINDDRLTLSEVFSEPGKVTNGLSLSYVYGDETATADDLLVEKETFVAAVRWAVPHEQELAATDKFDFWVIKAGAKQRDQAAANAVFTKTQVMYPKAKVQRDQVPAS